MLWSRIWRLNARDPEKWEPVFGSRSRAKKLSAGREGFRRRADNLAARRRYSQHGEAALVGAVGAQAEHAVDPRVARSIGQHLFAEALRALRLHQRGDQRDRVIGERRRAHRLLPEARAVTA